MSATLLPTDLPLCFPQASRDALYDLAVPQTVISNFKVETVATPLEEFVKARVNDDCLDQEATYFVDLGVVLKKYHQWISNLPRVKPFYAVKCNPNPAILNTLATLGVNFDCASKDEIDRVLSLGVAPNRIIYANPTKMKSHIKHANKTGVEMMTFDNADELYKVQECYPTAKLVLRIITDDSNSVCKFSTKFGAPLSDCPRLLSLAKELELDVIGVSFHVGSGCISVQSFVDAITSAHTVFQQAAEVGYTLQMLDLGGGWPGIDDGLITFPAIAEAIAPLLDDLFPDTELIAEPGRFFAAESHTLAVNVFAKREVTDGDEQKFLYYVSDGVYQSFNCILFDHYEPSPLVLDVGERTRLYKCTIFGPTCDSMDCIAKDVYLPELKVGEWLYFKNMGAYTVAAASPFNGFKSTPTTFYIQTPVTLE